jgi:hypothetical protein
VRVSRLEASGAEIAEQIGTSQMHDGPVQLLALTAPKRDHHTGNRCHAQAGQLREQITTRAEQPAAVEAELADLVTAGTMLVRLTGAGDDARPADIHQPHRLLRLENGGDAPAPFCWAFLAIAVVGACPWSADGLGRPRARATALGTADA